MGDGTATWVDAIWRRGLAPPPRLTVSQWADRHRILPPSSAEPGPWRTDRMPFLRAVMDAMTPDNGIERVVVMKSAQVGGTEAALNFLGHVMCHAPGTAMLVMPSTEMIRRNTPTRIDPLIEHTPALRAIAVPFRSRDPGNSATRKRFVGGELVMVGANSPIGLRSLPARYLVLDEVDAYPVDAGDEGDPVQLAMRATMTFGARRKVVLISTPSLAGFSRIETAYAESDRRRWHAECPSCGEGWVLGWEHLTWPEGRREAAYLACPHCGGIVDEAARQRIIREDRGAWRSTAAGDGRTAGFHIGGLMSPFQTLAEIALEHGQVYRDPARHKVFRNVRLGDLWHEEAAEPPLAASFLSRLEAWGERLPADVVTLTAGVDVQDDRLELEIVGWGRDEESWSIDHQALWGDPAGPDVWRTLDAELLRTFPHARAVPDLTVRAAAIDSGGHHTQSVYRFCAERAGRRVWAIKGRAGAGVPVWPRRPSRNTRDRSPIYLVGVDAAKETLYARLRLAEAGPGACHFPVGRPEDYFRQLTVERLVTSHRKGRPVREWKKGSSDRNEALDLRIYATAALHGLIALGLRLSHEASSLAEYPLKGDAAYQTMPPQRPSRIPSRWMRSAYGAA
ncbi:MAG: phage terminase large subunit family protein [Alphaproteobacteria bacterium]|nr:phage terminase large subunit family protein [Alphaproteobacteria bacterium]